MDAPFISPLREWKGKRIKKMKKKEKLRMPEVRRPKLKARNGKIKANSQLPESFKLQPTALKENSTVFLTIKPFIKGTFLFAEGRFSESQTVKTWMMIRIYNN
jgi:hypothetical protein